MSEDIEQVETVEPGGLTEEMEPVGPKDRLKLPMLEALLTITMISAAILIGVNIGLRIHSDHTNSCHTMKVDLLQATSTEVAKQTKVTYRVVSASGLGKVLAISNDDEISLSSDEGLIIEAKSSLEDCYIGFSIYPEGALKIQEAADGKFGLSTEDGFEDCFGIIVVFDASMRNVKGAVIFKIKPSQKSNEIENTI